MNAFFALGWIAANIDNNIIAAAHYYQKAARLNHPEAAYNLGYMHAQGQLNNGTKDDVSLLFVIQLSNK